MTKNKTLIYAQDVGGGQYIAPVVQNLLPVILREKYVIVVHPLSEEIFRRHSIPFLPLKETVGSLQVGRESWKAYIAEHAVSRILCTTSSPYRDLSNCNLILAAKDLDIPVMGVMDHWKGFDRFMREGVPVYMPTYICCIDEGCRQKILSMSLPARDIFVTGHPYLEYMAMQHRKPDMCRGSIRVLLISQPNTADKSFQGIYFLKRGQHRLIDEMTDQIKRTSLRQEKALEIYYRPHPKEQPVDCLPEGISPDEHPAWSQSLDNHDMFIGTNSMALIEANLAGKYCISLALPEFDSLTDMSIPISFPDTVRNIKDLETSIIRGIQAVTDDTQRPAAYPEFISNSIQNTLAVFRDFVQGSM